MNWPIQIGLASLALSGGLWAQQGENPFKPFDQAAFEAHLKDAGATEELLLEGKLQELAPRLFAQLLELLAQGRQLVQGLVLVLEGGFRLVLLQLLLGLAHGAGRRGGRAGAGAGAGRAW